MSVRGGRLVVLRRPAALLPASLVREDVRLMEKPKSVEAYFKGLPAEHRKALQKLRDTIAAAAPEAEDGITYSMPGFLLGGKGFVAYPAFKDHYSFFPMSGRAVEAHKNELGERVTGKGTIQFQYGERFPTALVKKVVRTRLAE